MKSNIQSLIILLILSFPLVINAQVGINTDGTDPDASAMMDVQSTTKGILLPRMTTSERTNINSAATGLLVYDTELKSLMVFDGTDWIAIRSQLADIDNDTRVWVEKTTNDVVNFDLNGSTQFTMGFDNEHKYRLAFKNNNLISIGENAGLNNRASYSHHSILIGKNTGWSTNDNISYHIAIGNEVLRNSEGHDGITIGYQATGGNTNGGTSSDIILGYQAGYKKEAGYTNVIVGAQAMGGNPDRPTYTNVFGYQAGYNISSDYSNIFGFQAGQNMNNISYGNDIIGFQAGKNITSGDYNLVIGNKSGFDLTTGDYNTLIGESAGAGLNTGEHNVIIGHEAGKNYTGTGSVFIGYQAGYNETNNERLYIENSNSSFPLIYGEFDNDYLQINGTLDVNGVYAFIGSSSAGAVQTNGNGTAQTVFMNTNQSISLNTNNLNLSNGGSVDLSKYKQTLALSGNTLSLSDGNNVDLSDFQQTLSINNHQLSISGGNTITLPAADNLGNHIMTQNLNMNGHWISNDGDNEGIYLESDGSVGINTNNTSLGMLVVNGSMPMDLTSQGNYGRLNDNGCGTSNSNSRSTSISAGDGVSADLLFAISDARIKNIQGTSNNNDDLETLMNIEITDYTYIDTFAKGTTPQKKVIAQQIAEVYPQAVDTNQTGIIPNILHQAKMDKNGWVYSNEALKVGDKIQIEFENGQELLAVLEVKENAFRVQPTSRHSHQETVFLYGTQVSDFHIVDYNALKMLNISATQALVKQNEALQQQQAALEAKLERLKQQAAKIDEIEVRVLELKAKKEN